MKKNHFHPVFLKNMFKKLENHFNINFNRKYEKFLSSFFKYENKYDIFTVGSLYHFLSKKNFQKITNIKDDQEKIFAIFSKLRNSSDEYFEFCLNFFIQNNKHLYDPEKRKFVNEMIDFNQEFKNKCLLLDEYVFDPNAHDEFAISTKFLDYHFLTQDFRNKLTNYEQKDALSFVIPLDIKLVLNIKVKDAMKGDKVIVKYLRHSYCECCENDFNKRVIDCRDCTHVNEICNTCKGTRKNIKIEKCSICDDNIFIREKIQKSIDLPKDLINGQVLKFPGMGNINEKRVAGDLKIKLNIISDDEYSVEENYIEKKISIPFDKFVTGGQVHFNHPRGKGEFHLAESTHPGIKKIFSNLGLSEYFDNEEEEFVRGILVLDVGTKIPYNEKNNKILEDFATKLKRIEDEKELKKLNKLI